MTYELTQNSLDLEIEAIEGMLNKHKEPPEEKVMIEKEKSEKQDDFFKEIHELAILHQVVCIARITSGFTKTDLYRSHSGKYSMFILETCEEDTYIPEEK